MTDTAVLDYSAIAAPSALPKVLHRAAGWSLFAAIVVAAFVAGLILRRWAWDQTEPIRYLADINNAFRQGSFALRTGYINRYDDQMSRSESEGAFMDLDYAPGRLFIAHQWAQWVRTKFDPPLTGFDRLTPTGESFYVYARRVHRQYEWVKPLLLINLTGEILTAIAMFFLVKRYTSGKPPSRSLRYSEEPDSSGARDPALRSTSETGLGGPYHPVRGTILGLVAALFFWFDPALIWNAHCWPQWDSWVMPFFMWAVLLASLDWWFCAGALIAAGAMFKGQILFGAPVFLLWPLFQGRLPAICRWIVGFFTAVAVITVPWSVRIPGVNPNGEHFYPGSTNPHAIAWLIYLALIFLAMTTTLLWPRQRFARIPLGMVLAAVIMWLIAGYTTQTFSIIGFIVLSAAAWFVDDQCAKWSWHAKLPLAWLAVALLIYPAYGLTTFPWVLLTVILAAIGVATLMLYAPRKAVPYAAAGWISAAILLCIPIFNSSHGWYDLGFAYGTHHFERMGSGNINNLPELLQDRWGWDDLMAPTMTITAGPIADHISTFLTQVDPGVHLQPGSDIELPLKYFLVGVWLTCIVICALGASIHDRNRSPRFLAAIVAPWIVFFAVMTQMHQRYLLWGASLSAMSSVLSPGYALLHFFLSIVSTTQEMQTMMNNPLDPANHGQYTHYFIYQFIDSWHPGIAWAVLLTAAIFVYTAIKLDRTPSVLGWTVAFIKRRFAKQKQTAIQPTINSTEVKVADPISLPVPVQG